MPARTWHLISSALVLYPPSLWRNRDTNKRRVTSRGGPARQVFNKSAPRKIRSQAASWRVCLSNTLVSNLTISRWDTRGSQRKLFSKLFSLLFLSFFLLFFICQGFIVSFILDIPPLPKFHSSGKNRMEGKDLIRVMYEISNSFWIFVTERVARLWFRLREIGLEGNNFRGKHLIFLKLNLKLWKAWLKSNNCEMKWSVACLW